MNVDPLIRMAEEFYERVRNSGFSGEKYGSSTRRRISQSETKTVASYER